MAPRQVEHHLQVRQGHAVAPLHGELHLPVYRAHVNGAHLGAFVKAVAGNRAGHLVHDGAYRRVVGAQNGRAVKRHAVQKVDKGLLKAAKVVAVGFHVVGVDIGHHRHHRQQVQKRRVRLVGFDHDVVAAAQPRVGARAVQAPANHKSWVQTSLGQHAGHQAGGGGFAVGARNGNALFEAHQLGEHQGARHHWDVQFACAQHLGVAGLHGRGSDHRIGPRHMRRVVAYVGLYAQRGQAAQGGAVSQVRARDGVAQVVQYFGNAGHARTAYAYKVDALHSVFHGASSSQAATMAWVAWMFSRALAAWAWSKSVARSQYCNHAAKKEGVSAACGASQPAPWSTRKRAL